MGENSAIAWTDHTFSPWWGCQRVSPGCGMGKSVGGCYAEAWSKRLGFDIWGPDKPRRFMSDKYWGEPIKWNRKAAAAGTRYRVFCASMADVFEDRRDLDTWRERLWSLIEMTAHLDWLLLTKRPENMTTLAPPRWAQKWPRNVWAGATMESQTYYDKRWPLLALVPAAVRFVSHEPAIGPLWLMCERCGKDTYAHRGEETTCGGVFPDWVITGGESGGGPRPYELQWARALIRQTRGTQTKLFVKQLGANPVDDLTEGKSPLPYKRRLTLVEKAGANPAEWPADLLVREWPSSQEAA